MTDRNKESLRPGWVTHDTTVISGEYPTCLQNSRKKYKIPQGTIAHKHRQYSHRFPRLNNSKNESLRESDDEMYPSTVPHRDDKKERIFNEREEILSKLGLISEWSNRQKKKANTFKRGVKMKIDTTIHSSMAPNTGKEILTAY